MKTLNKQFGSLAGIFIFILLFSFSLTAFSQKKFSIQIGAGIGSTLAKNDNAGKKGRVMLNLNGYYNLTNQLSFGAELATAGSFITSLGGSAREDKYDPATNTITKDVSNMKSNAVLAKVKYYFISDRKTIRPFAEFGIGSVNHYENVFNISGIPEKKISRTKLGYQPEIGITFRHIQLSVRYLMGGKTPTFAGVDEQGTKVKYESIHISPLFLHVSWRLDF